MTDHDKRLIIIGMHIPWMSLHRIAENGEILNTQELQQRMSLYAHHVARVFGLELEDEALFQDVDAVLDQLEQFPAPAFERSRGKELPEFNN